MFVTAYLTLNEPPPAADALASPELDKRLRLRYLDLVRRFSAPAHAERLACVVAAYQQVANPRARAHYALQCGQDLATAEDGLRALAAAGKDPASGPPLAALAAACESNDA